QLLRAGYREQLPDGVRWDASVEDYDNVQLDIQGYDPEVYVAMELAALGRHDPKDDRTRRSHLSLIASRQVDKIINVPVLKDHGSAGVTLALKNLSHGLVNNVARSHLGLAYHGGRVGPVQRSGPNQCNTFIPTAANQKPTREHATRPLAAGLNG